MPKTNIKAPILGADGNAYVLLGICHKALRDANRNDLWPEFRKEATSGNYDHLLCTIIDYFELTTFGESDLEGQIEGIENEEEADDDLADQIESNYEN